MNKKIDQWIMGDRARETETERRVIGAMGKKRPGK